MRVFRLAQTWPTMKRILAIMLSSLGALANLTLVLGIIIYIFAIIGMQLFSKEYTADKFEPDKIPRWNFTDFWHSLVLIFRILCGEWIEPLWDCMRASGELCMVVFLPTLILGNFMVNTHKNTCLTHTYSCVYMSQWRHGCTTGSQPVFGASVERVCNRRTEKWWKEWKGRFQDDSGVAHAETTIQKEETCMHKLWRHFRKHGLLTIIEANNNASL